MTTKAVPSEQPLGEYANDRELASACVAETPGAFDALMQRYQRQVYHLCYRFVGNHEDASDLSQEVFVRAHRGLRRFKGGSALSTWIYRIGVNVCLSHVSVRRPVTEQVDPDQHVDGRSPDPVDLVARGERASVVKEAIARLPTKQRGTLILRIYHDMTHKEIAVVLGNSEGAVKANYFHALRRMKRLLQGVQCSEGAIARREVDER
jgi:RNA polymerase sigma-70 factor (ECF subfamily)